MVITTTAVGFLSLALGLGICGAWFLRAFKKAGSFGDRKISLLLSYLFLGVSLQHAIMGIGSVIFSHFSNGLYYIFLFSNIIVVFTATLGIYTAYYIFSPKKSSKISFILTFVLGLIVITTLIVTHPQPFLTTENGIDWNMNLQSSVLLFYLLFINIGSQCYIFSRLFFSAKTRVVKNLSLTIALLAAGGITNVFIRLILLANGSANLRTTLTDYMGVIIGIGFVVFFVLVPIFKNFFVNTRNNS